MLFKNIVKDLVVIKFDKVKTNYCIGKLPTSLIHSDSALSWKQFIQRYSFYVYIFCVFVLQRITETKYFFGSLYVQIQTDWR